MSFKEVVGRAIAVGVMLGSASFAQATQIPGSVIVPLIVAGDPNGVPPDSPDNRIDPNVSSSKFSGVVSLYITYPENGVQQGFICSGALVGKRQVVSAGHCVDTNGNGKYVDLKAPGQSISVVFNSDGDYNRIIRASSFAVHSDYQGFNNCPDGSRGCVNDDVAVVTLSADAPASAKIYKVAVNPLTSGQRIIMAGYGTSGDGIDGHYVSPDFAIKRSGENYIDLLEGDDEQDFGGKAEVYYADFDGGGKDTWCTYAGVCTPKLANDVEAGIGGGDSGGPSFVEMYGELMLVANNTFGGYLAGAPQGAFGSYFGGMIMSGYTDFLLEATGGNISLVPEPASAALLGLGSLMALGARRRRKPSSK
ncbi:trypsin-like serine protease [Massilia sp. UMI-21]|nr:trypsin-like serine protease [Massilia sp. UMI-21]